MGFVEKFRDKTRDSLCADLRALGINAQMSERGRSVEKVGKSWRGRSLGLIEVQDSPIRWVNVVDKPPILTTSQPGQQDAYANLYLVPDSTISKAGFAESFRVKNVPVFGHVVGVRWDGTLPSDIVEQLGEYLLLSKTLINLEEDIRIESHPEYGYWSICSKRFKSSSFFSKRQPAPSREQWECYETIARHLLESSGK